MVEPDNEQAAGSWPPGVTGNRNRPTGRWWGAVGLLTALGTVPRLVASADSLAWDELYLWAWVHDRGFGAMLDTVAAKEKTPPLGFMLAWLSDQLGGGPQLIRLPEVIAGIGLIPLIALLARRTFGAGTGLAAAALAAASPMLVFYSVEARSYGLTAALCVAATLLALRVIDTGSRRAAAGYAVTAAAALMSHYTAFAVLAVLAVFTFIAWPRARRLIAIAQAGPMLATLIWIPGLIDQTRISADELARIASVAPLSLDTVASIIGRNLIGHPLAPLSRMPSTLGLTLIAVGAAIALGFAVRRLITWLGSANRVNPAKETALMVALALAAPVAAILISLQPHQSMLFPRNLMASLPAALILAAALLARPPKPAALIATSLVAAGLAVGTWIEVTDAQRPNAQAAADAVASRWQRGDRIVELCCLTGGDGPLGTAVELALNPHERRSLSVLSRTGDRPYVDSLADGGRLFVIGYVPDGARSQMFLNPPSEWSKAYRKVWQRRWPGLLDAIATEYVPRG